MPEASTHHLSIRISRVVVAAYPSYLGFGASWDQDRCNKDEVLVGIGKVGPCFGGLGMSIRSRIFTAEESTCPVGC